MVISRQLFGKLALGIVLVLTIAGVGHRHQAGGPGERACAVCVWNTPGTLATEAAVEFAVAATEIRLLEPPLQLPTTTPLAVERRARGPPSIV